jgi:hypothetical protein
MAGKTYNLKLKINVDGTQELVLAGKAAKEVNKAAKDTAGNISVLDRATKSVAGNSKNASSAFAKQAQGMGGLVHVYATVAANVWALTAAFDVLKNAADLSIMAKAAEDLSKSTGTSFAAVAKSMQEITGGAISFTDAMRQANLALSGGASLEQVEKITEIANKAANTLGLSVPNAVGRMIQAVTKGEPELVDELGIILRVTKATEEYAAQINKTALELTTFEKQQAIINQLITQGEDKFSEVEQRTNPFAKLIASTSNLVKTSLQEVSDIIGPIVSVIADNASLVFVGFGLIASRILKLIIPTLVTTREQMQKFATEDSVKAKAALEQVNQAAQKIAKTTARIGQLQQQNQKFAGRPDAAGAFKSFTEEGALFQSLDKRKKIGLAFKEIIDKGLKEGLNNAEVFEAVKKSKILKKIQGAIGREDFSIFKKDTSKNQIELVNDEISTIRQLANAESKLIALRKSEGLLVTKQQIALRKQLNATIQATFAQGRLEIAQNNELLATKAVLTKAINNLNKAYAAAAAGQGVLTRAMLFGQQAAKTTILAISSAGSFISGVFNRLFGAVSTAVIIFQTLKTAGIAVGLLNKEFHNNTSALRDNQSTLNEALEKYKDFNDELETMPDNVEAFTKQWSKAAGVVDQYAESLEKVIKQAKVLATTGVLDNIISLFSVGSEKGAGILSIRKAMEEIEEITGKPFNIEIEFTKNDELIRQEQFISNLQEQVLSNKNKPGLADELRDAQAQYEKFKKLVEEREGSLVQVININKDTSDKDLLTIFENVRAQAALQAKATPSITEALFDVKSIDAAAKAGNTAISSLDDQLTKLRNKSESRRILNVDTLIKFRDQFKIISKEVKDVLGTNVDAIKKQGAATLITDIPTDLKNAFLPSIKDLTDVNQLYKALNIELNTLDKRIDGIRNFKSEIGELTEESKRLRIERERGNLDKIPLLYKNATDQLQRQSENLEDLIGLQKQLAKIIDRDQNKNIAVLNALKAQKETIDKKLSLRKEELGELTKNLAIQERIVNKEENKVKLIKEQLNNTKTLISLNTSFSSVAVKLLEKQTKDIETLFVLELSSIALQEKKLELKLREEKLLKPFADHSNGETELLKLKLDKEALILQNLSQQRDIRLEMIEAENNARGQVGQGFVNSFSTMFSEGFGADFQRQMAITAREMGEQMANPIENAVNIFMSATSTATSTLVDALINRTWDGEEEGRSFGEAMVESLKATLRESIGQAIKDNMNQAIANLIGNQDSVLAGIDSQIQANASLTTATTVQTTANEINTQSINNLVTVQLGLSTATDLNTQAIMANTAAKGGDITLPTQPLRAESVESTAVATPIQLDTLGPSFDLNTEATTSLAATQGIQTTASEINTQATTSLATAQGVQTTASEINTQAVTGLSTAQGIQTTASEINTQAITGLSTAQGIQTTASEVNTQTIASLVTSLGLDTVATELNTQAIMANTAAQSTSGGDLSGLGSLLNGGSSTIGPTTMMGGGGTTIPSTHHFAKGGVVDTPTTAVIGEGGTSEAIVPLPNNRAIPVQLDGDTGNNNVTISQNFDFRGADSGTEARLRQFAQQIKKETTKEIFDSINRGGSAAKTVGRR